MILKEKSIKEWNEWKLKIEESKQQNIKAWNKKKTRELFFFKRTTLFLRVILKKSLFSMSQQLLSKLKCPKIIQIYLRKLTSLKTLWKFYLCPMTHILFNKIMNKTTPSCFSISHCQLPMVAVYWTIKCSRYVLLSWTADWVPGWYGGKELSN